MPASTSDAIAGCLMGGAVGDAMGLPFEGLSPLRIARLRKGALQYRFFFGYGMVSDDTDHAIFVSQALIIGKGEVNQFRRALAWRLRFWLLCLPPGVGFATLRSIMRLWLGLSNSGVYSAGNGPCMRSGMIGAILAHDVHARRVHVQASTVMTHTDPKAFAGAMAIAEVVARIVNGQWQGKPQLDELIAVLTDISPDADWRLAVTHINAACKAPDSMAVAQQYFGGQHGVSGYALHTVPFALIAWYQHYGDYRATIETVVRAGGDTDTVAAIAGGLAGASVGLSGIPVEWRTGLADCPHSGGYLTALGRRICKHDETVSLRFSFLLFPRNMLFLVIVLLHGFRRLLPPY